MPSANYSNSSLALTPLGAGDLIDRAVRFYRNNFWTFFWIAAPPILFGTILSIGWTILGREFFSSGATKRIEDEIFSILFSTIGTVVIFSFQIVALLVVMGGASRNFVRHLLFGETVTFRETYSNVKTRLGGLIIASFLIVFLLGFIGVILFYVGLAIALIVIGIIITVFQSFPPLMIPLSSVFGGAVLFGTGWVFFLIASRFVYIPQIMLVEGQGVGAAISRSTSLASGKGTRIYALFIFTFVAIYSAMMLFYVPLGWYAYLNGIELFGNDIDAIPAWYIIANQLVTQISLILLSPILMIGLCLLYVDERVRSEGYDIELMAARNLGEIPALPTEYSNPLQPALSSEALQNISNAESSQKSSTTTLGLN